MNREKDKFYNVDIKEEYLNTIDNELIRTFTSYPLAKAKATEELYGKDLYDMTGHELSEVFTDFTCTSLTAVQNYGLRVEDYINWAIKKGYRKSNLNPLETVDKGDYYKKFVAVSRNYYFQREDIVELIGRLNNKIDQVILLSLFEGIKGKGFSEILNMQVKDLYMDGKQHKVKLYDADESTRELEISELLYNLIKSANRDKDYIERDGDAQELEDSPYVIRKAKRGKQGSRLTFAFISRKFIMFKEEFGMEHLKAKHITDSGIMHMANELQENHVLNTDDIEVIGSQFDTTSSVLPNGKRYRNATVIKRIIEIDAFEQMYGYKMNFKANRKQVAE